MTEHDRRSRRRRQRPAPRDEPVFRDLYSVRVLSTGQIGGRSWPDAGGRATP